MGVQDGPFLLRGLDGPDQRLCLLCPCGPNLAWHGGQVFAEYMMVEKLRHTAIESLSKGQSWGSNSDPQACLNFFYPNLPESAHPGSG